MEIPIEKILDGYTINAPDRSVRKQAKQVIQEVTGVEVPLEAVLYQKGQIRVDVSPLTRSQIHIHKDAILDKLSKKLQKKQVKDMR